MYAICTDKTATLTYNANSCGTAPANETLTYASAATAKAMTTVSSSKTFTKWCTANNWWGTCYTVGQTVKAANTTPSDITLYAICRDKDNWECDNSEPYGCANSTNSIINIERIKYGWVDVWVSWYCKWNDGTSSQCEYRCWEWETFSWNDTLHNGICVKMECPTPTITNVCDNKVYFDLNWANATSVSMRFSETNEWDWDVSIGSYIWWYTSPRTLSSPYNKWFIKLRTACSGGVYSDSSEAFAFDTEKSCDDPGSSSSSCFFPTMVIDDISNCKLTYHFNEYTPTNDPMLWWSTDNENFSPVTSAFTSPVKIFPHWSSWRVYIKYRQKCGSDYQFSDVYTYDMPYQSCSPATTTTTIKVDRNGDPFEWELGKGYYEVNWNIYDGTLNYYTYCTSGQLSIGSQTISWDWSHRPYVRECFNSPDTTYGFNTVYVPVLTYTNGHQKWCSMTFTTMYGWVVGSRDCTSRSDIYKNM